MEKDLAIHVTNPKKMCSNDFECMDDTAEHTVHP